MFVGRKKNLINRLFDKIFVRKYHSNYSNIAFTCIKEYPGFEKGIIYKPFAYSVDYTCAEPYTNFALFDKEGRVFYMEKRLIKKGYFKVLMFSELISTNRRTQSIEAMFKIDEMNENYIKDYIK